MKHFNIALDGPSGAGKSTVAKMLSKKLGILYLDTGALYRAVGLKAFREGWPEDSDKVSDLLKNTLIRVKYDKDTNTQSVYLDGQDVSKEIRQNVISDYASRFSALPSVRAFLLNLQRDIADEYNSILDGRDIGTCVLPNADIKIFLTASSKVRAERRYKELLEKGEKCDPDKILEEIEARDYRDSHRAVAPLKKADDAVEINSDELTAEQVSEIIVGKVRAL